MSTPIEDALLQQLARAEAAVDASVLRRIVGPSEPVPASLHFESTNSSPASPLGSPF